MKFCVEDAVSAAQGGTVVGPPPLPPPQVGNWTGFMKKIFSFFSLRKSTGKKISYILLSTVTYLYQDLMKVWSSVLKMQWVQLKVGLQLNPPPPPNRKLDWIHEEKFFIFFHSENQLEKKISYILLSTVTHLYQDLMKVWSSVLKMQWVHLKVGLQLGPPPPPKVGNWTGFAKKNLFIFFTQKINWKKKLSPGKSVCWHRSQPI